MKKLVAYGKERFRLLKRALTSYPSSRDPELLHKARVEIKRIKTLLNLIQFGSKKFDAHQYYIPFRAIFRECFAIREPQVMEQLINSTKHQQPSKTAIRGSAINLFVDHIPQHLVAIRKSRGRIVRELTKVSARDFRRYRKQIKSELRSRLHPRFSKDTLHKSRKLAKEIMFLEAIDLPKKKREPFYDAFAHLVGNWHDFQVLIEKLKTDQTANASLIKEIQVLERRELQKVRKLVIDHYSNKK